MARESKAKVDVSKMIYEVDGYQLTFAQLCAHFGLKYNSVYGRVQKGMEITEAVKDCIHTPRTWGNTYSDPNMVVKMPEGYKPVFH